MGMTPALEHQLYVIWQCFSKPIGGEQAMDHSQLSLFLAALNRNSTAPSLLCSQLFSRYSGSNGTMSYQSFFTMVCNESLPGLGGAPAQGAGAVQGELANVFSLADLDGDAVLSHAEVKRLMELDGAPASQAEVAAVMEEGGVSKGGRGLTLSQFLDLCVKTQVLSLGGGGQH